MSPLKKQIAAVDFDGTLVHYDGWVDVDHIGQIVPEMIEFVTRLLEQDWYVTIFTARLSTTRSSQDRTRAYNAIQNWIAGAFPNWVDRIDVSADKHPDFKVIIDDRAVAVARNIGKLLNWPPEAPSPNAPLPSLPADFISADLGVAFSPPPSVPEILREAADLYEQRNKVYGDNYKTFGKVMAVMFPEGVTAKSAEEWNRLTMFINCLAKLGRYAVQLPNGGHLDSALDLAVYSTMLNELTEKR